MNNPLAQLSEGNLGLPKEALVNKFIAKSKFYEKTKLTPKLQREFVQKIQKITWKYKLAESTLGISKTDRVTEIQIFELELKEPVIPQQALRVIDRYIPYPILFRFVYDSNVAFGISLKDDTKVEHYYLSEWNQQLRFDFSGIDLERVYQKLILAFIQDEVHDSHGFYEVVQKNAQQKALEAEVGRLEQKVRTEKQFNRKVEIHKVLVEKKAELERLVNTER